MRLVVTGLQSTAPGFGALLLSFPTAPSIGLEVRVARREDKQHRGADKVILLREVGTSGDAKARAPDTIQAGGERMQGGRLAKATEVWMAINDRVGRSRDSSPRLCAAACCSLLLQRVIEPCFRAMQAGRSSLAR